MHARIVEDAARTQGLVLGPVRRTELTSRTAIFLDGFSKRTELDPPPEDILGAVFSRDDPELGIVCTANAAAPPRYYLVRRNKLELLYDSNQSGIDNKYFSEARSLNIPSFDGQPIPTHLFIPNGTSSDSPRLVIVWIHGGPDDHVYPDEGHGFTRSENEEVAFTRMVEFLRRQMG